MRAANCLALALAIAAPVSSANAQDRAATPYSNADIDAMIADLRRAIDAEAAARQAAEGKIGASIAAEASAAARANDAEAAARRAADDKIGASIAAEASANDAKLKALNDKIPTAPWYASTLLGAILGALAAFFSSMFFAQTARVEADRVRRRAASNALCDQWRDMEGPIANALYLVGHPADLVDPRNRNIIVGYGNWLNRLGARWRAGELDIPNLKSESLDTIARNFWGQLATASATLAASGDPQQQAAATALDGKTGGWTDFQWLATQP